MEFRPLGRTGMQVSLLGLGTIKLGRAEQVKYPQPFSIPDGAAARRLLACARELGINLIDTAPAYGDSEARLGELLAEKRQEWIVCTKVGEQFAAGRSTFDFSAPGARHSVERSLQQLRTDYLDVVLIHSDGRDRDILQHE
jgi:aryl-alcohol dehydrogenase-like predicted oxidoreductase